MIVTHTSSASLLCFLVVLRCACELLHEFQNTLNVLSQWNMHFSAWYDNTCMYRYSCVIDKNSKSSLWFLLPILRMSKLAQDNIEDARIASSCHSSVCWLDERATRRLLDHRDAHHFVTEHIPSLKHTAIKSLYLYISFSEPIMVTWARLGTICLRHDCM